jgi:hypothetical protein
MKIRGRELGVPDGTFARGTLDRKERMMTVCLMLVFIRYFAPISTRIVSGIHHEWARLIVQAGTFGGTR